MHASKHAHTNVHAARDKRIYIKKKKAAPFIHPKLNTKTINIVDYF